MRHVSDRDQQCEVRLRRIVMAKGIYVITSDDVRTKTDQEIADELSAAMNATDDETEGE